MNASPPAGRGRARSSHPGHAHGPARVLVADPDEGVRALLGRLVRLAGHEPVLAGGSVAERHGPFDLALLDPATAAMRELAAALQARAPDRPLVFLGVPRPGAEPSVEPAAYLVKPFTRAQLERAIAQVLERRTSP